MHKALLRTSLKQIHTHLYTHLFTRIQAKIFRKYFVKPKYMLWFFCIYFNINAKKLLWVLFLFLTAMIFFQFIYLLPALTINIIILFYISKNSWKSYLIFYLLNFFSYNIFLPVWSAFVFIFRLLLFYVSEAFFEIILFNPLGFLYLIFVFC